mgnify:CR=1 FL=1
MSCNTADPGVGVPDPDVSIPIGFSNELQRTQNPVQVRIPPVSIPIGFSNELQRSSTPGWTRTRHVSIPIGFSNELQRTFEEVCQAAQFYVSIPIGFSNELQPLLGVHAKAVLRRFNPYRVFQ